MTNETRERIKFYKNALPHMKEKLAAAIMMLVVAASVTVTATYAWVTLSTAPEVTSIDTTVAANGSLEIALANGTGFAPAKSAEGDSSAAEGQSIVSANTTWGNLVNLSDPSYGLSNITLRPAALNGTTGLQRNPLYGVNYGADGRVSEMVTGQDFAYTYFDNTTNKFAADFGNEHLGVRAISTIKYENATGDLTYSKMSSALQKDYDDAQKYYLVMSNRSEEPGTTYMNALEGLMQIYAQNVLDGNAVASLVIANKAENLDYVTPLNSMMIYFRDEVMARVADCYVYMANLFDLVQGTGQGNIYEDWDALLSDIDSLPSFFSEIKLNNRTFAQSLKLFAADYTKIITYTRESEAGDYSEDVSNKESSLGYHAYRAQQGEVVRWGDIDTIINWVCDINSATLDGNLLKYLKSNVGTILTTSNHEASLNGGAIYNMEERLGVDMSPTISVTVRYKGIPASLSAKLITSAKKSENWEQMKTERAEIVSLNMGGYKGTDAVAEDTYAMAIDLWLRTNAGAEEATVEVSDAVTNSEVGTETTTKTTFEQAYLTLEGKADVDVQIVQQMVKDANGEEQPGWYAEYTLDSDSVRSKQLVFERDGAYWINNDETDLNFETSLTEWNNGTLPEDLEYTMAVEQEIVTVNGYEGENRVWDSDEVNLYVPEGYDSTTQGSGSCYIFYANSPADRNRFLELLDSMKVVFINAEGKMIGSAYMDTKYYYAENAKVTVPLTLDKSSAIYLGKTIDDEEIYGLTALNKNEPMRITALIYLNGKTLTNDMVLASGDIQGSLNLQFGSSVAISTTTTTVTVDTDGNEMVNSTTDFTFGDDSEAIKQEELMSQGVKVSATINNSEKIEMEFDPDNPLTPTLAVNIEGDLAPKNGVTARFMRAISSTQGVLLDPIQLSGSGSNWNSTCTFDKPGTYVLRSVWIDGAEYSLGTPITVVLNGSTVNSVSCDKIPAGESQATLITSDSYVTADMTLGFTTSKSAPSSVKGIFYDDSGRPVNVEFYLKDGTWKGTARFSISGTYTMEYVEIDGELFSLNESLCKTLEIYLGVKADVQFDINPDTLEVLQKVYGDATATQFVWTESVSLGVTAKIYDSTGEEIKDLSDVILYYGRLGSSDDTGGLDTNLIWKASKGCYEGMFDVDSAGTFRFSKVSIGKSDIDEAITAENIQAMPLHDAYYDNNPTDDYIYAPNLDAAFTVDVAYSFAASKMTATIVKLDGTDAGKEWVVEGERGTTEANGYISPWYFEVPDTDATEASRTQEGKWQLKDITMYGVYYNDVPYFGENGVTIDLTSENIRTKVINYLYVNVDVDSTRTFSDVTFMADNIESGITVTVKDYEGKAVEGMTIEELYLTYYLNPNSVTLEKYGYESDGLEAVPVKGKGTPVSGSSTEFAIADMNFQYVGLYNSCAVTFDTKLYDVLCGKNVIMTYTENDGAVTGIKNDSTGAPCYEVRWNAPELKITSVSPSGTDLLPYDNNWNHQDDVVNWVSADKYSAVVYLYCDHGTIYRINAPKVKMELSNIGSAYNSATVSVPNGKNINEAQIYTFTPSSQAKSTNEQTIGYASGTALWSHNGLSKNAAGKQTIKEVTIASSIGTWTADLPNDIIINQPEVAPELSFTGLSNYPNATVPDTITTGSGKGVLSNDGSNSMTVTLPEVTWSQEANVGDPDATTKSNESTTTSNVCYYTTASASLGRTTYTYHKYSRTTYQYTETSSVDVYKDTYRVKKWKINGTEYDPGTEINITGKWTATAVIERVSHDYQSTVSKSRIVKEITDVSAGTSTSTGWWASLPNGYTDVGSAAKIYTTKKTFWDDWT